LLLPHAAIRHASLRAHSTIMKTHRSLRVQPRDNVWQGCQVCVMAYGIKESRQIHEIQLTMHCQNKSLQKEQKWTQECSENVPQRKFRGLFEQCVAISHVNVVRRCCTKQVFPHKKSANFRFHQVLMLTWQKEKGKKQVHLCFLCLPKRPTAFARIAGGIAPFVAAAAGLPVPLVLSPHQLHLRFALVPRSPHLPTRSSQGSRRLDFKKKRTKKV